MKDHLGNARISFADMNNNQVVDVPGDILQENHYYAFGMQMNGSWMNNATQTDNRYQYNGKEMNDDFGLNLYDYGARMYDPVLGRWNGVDPLASKYAEFSPYVFVVNNPLIYIDPDGMDIIIAVKGRGEAADIKRQEHLAKLQSLTNDRLSIGRDGKVTIASKAEGGLNELSKPAGTTLLRNLINGIEQEDGSVKNYTVTIVPDNINSTDPVNANGVTTTEAISNSENGIGTGSVVTFNIDGKGEKVLNEDGSTGRPSQVGLAHELIHAKNNMMGTNKSSEKNTGVADPETRDGSRILSREEINTRIEEQQIRREQNTKLRKEPNQS